MSTNVGWSSAFQKNEDSKSYIGRMFRRYSMIFCLLLLSCTPDSRPVEVEEEIIEMNWYSTVKDFYISDQLTPLK